MKKILTIIALFTIAINADAKIWRVNNTSGVTADFTTAQAAHNGATAGDTIHLEPSTTSYGALTTTKKLVWISTGYFLTNHPGTQYSSTAGTVDLLNVNAGSQNSVFSINMSYGQISTSNITFQRCVITSGNGIYFYSGNNCVIIGCFINGSLNVVNGNTNIIISNNIISSNVSVSSNSSAVLTNNIFNYVSSGGNAIYNSQLQNNIIDRATTNYTFTNCVLNNNMANNTSLPAGNGNVNSVTMTTVFTNDIGNGNSTDGDYVLKAGSPAIGTGYGGTDMGVFGGSTPFVLALQPAIPSIYQLTAPASPSGSTMNVTFSTKSNN